jgi:hypothetical protein
MRLIHRTRSRTRTIRKGQILWHLFEHARKGDPCMHAGKFNLSVESSLATAPLEQPNVARARHAQQILNQ